MFSTALALTLPAPSLLAQQADISPLPQSVSWGSKAFDATTAYVIHGADTADSLSVALLRSSLQTAESGGISITIGQSGDEAVSAYETKIPAQAQGYYLSVGPEGVVIAGRDDIGTYYGVQTFLQIAAQPEVMSVSITDYPNVLERGVVEGFYGNPWSETDRKRQFAFYGANKMNIYIYGPKDDPYHRNRWRENYPANKAAELKRLIEAAHENKVQFTWALHPGLDIKWNKTDSLNVLNKLESVYQLGCRRFAIFFDDISGDGGKAANQAALLNYVTEEFIHKHNLEPLIMCPTAYNRAYMSGDYLQVLGANTNPEVHIMWTGNSVVDMINKSDLDYVNPIIKRNAYIWLNYPVNDYCIDHMLMGKLYGNDQNIATQLSGFTSNPMEYAEASKVALFSLADYTWNMADYNPQQSWERAISYLMPEHKEAFRTFCESNVDLGSTYHGLRREGETPDFTAPAESFKASVDTGYNEQKATAVRQQFDNMVNAADELLQSTEEPELIAELTPWLQVMKLQAQRGQKLMDLFKFIHEEQPDSFINTYLQMQELEKEQKDIRSRDFEGSIKNPNPAVATTYVAPFLTEMTSRAVAEYKKNFDYRLDVFPTVLLEDGRYYIKYNNQYLTNNGSATSLGDYPTFKATMDQTNPQRQEWNITMDYSTNRYKIVNANDGRYLNELGTFAKSNDLNPYEAAWHTYNMLRTNGKYCIQNAGSAGDKYWTVSNGRINQGSSNAWNINNVIFELQPTDSARTYPLIEEGKTYYIKSGNLYLTSTNLYGTGGTPTFKAKQASNLNQKWKFSIDATTGRYKLVNGTDNRYVNELGNFGTNAYYPSWNSYIITELGGLFSIQNAGEGGSNFWLVSDNRISPAAANRGDSYIFEIVSTELPSGINGTTQDEAMLTYRIDANTLQVGGRTGITGLQLYDSAGRAVASSRGSNVISITGLPKGTYVLSVKGTGWNTSAKIKL